MPSLWIECLRCGDLRVLQPDSHHRVDGGECSRCGYVGWAASAELDEPARRVLRERPPASRRIRLVA